MSTSTPTRTDSRLGYVVAIVVNAILLGLVNTWPGWQAVPFLTDDAASVVTLVNLSLWVGIVTNLVYVVADPPWLKALGTAVATAITLAVLLRTLQVFPFDFGDSTVNWDFWVRFWLWFLVAAVGIALLVQVVRFLRILVLGPGADRD
jgi:hypothetical protein